ncbi:hypothetical protein DAI22_07g009500 [Oryza sativa Japonica Group]|nr:hypothetical protein DAI22_07g009500 [Oryza sativa Japonica Group]
MDINRWGQGRRRRRRSCGGSRRGGAGRRTGRRWRGGGRIRAAPGAPRGRRGARRPRARRRGRRKSSASTRETSHSFIDGISYSGGAAAAFEESGATGRATPPSPPIAVDLAPIVNGEARASTGGGKACASWVARASTGRGGRRSFSSP